MKTILLCTVGGSHEPILKSIETSQPDFVCFICSDTDRDTGKQGSEKQITGKGMVISVERDAPPSLPNIPTQANLESSQFSFCLVPADDLDKAFLKIHQQFSDLQQNFPEATLIADYTGGTKTMTAALVTAALETENTTLKLVTGARANLVRVAKNSEYTIEANVDSIRLQRQMKPYLGAWVRYAFDEAAQGLDQIRIPSNEELRSQLNRAKNLSSAFSAWDRFDHKAALEQLIPYKSKIGQSLSLHLKALALLTEEDGKRREPLQIYDLWLNAERRATQGRYDDAVARVYRLIEWTAQWQLRQHHGIDTANIPEDKIPQHLSISKNRDGKYQTGLMQSWQLVGSLIDKPAGKFIKDNEKVMLNHLLIRNQSILAHGYEPVGQQQWQCIAGWMLSTFLPVLHELIKNDAEIRFDLNRLQLPNKIDLIEMATP